MTVTAGGADAQPGVTPQIVQYATPPVYRTEVGWVVSGVRRQWEGVGLAAVVTWTGLPLALWLAALGALAGALLGAFGFTATGLASSLHLNESVGFIGALLGAIEGIAAGFAAIYLLFFHNPAAFLGAVASGLIIGSITLVALLAGESYVMSARGYRVLSRREGERLYPLLVRAGARMGLSEVPALWMSDSQKPAAWCHPTAIVVTRGLLGEADASEAGPRSDLDDAALGAILAHELCHWGMGDAVGLRAVWACFWPVVGLYNAGAWLRTRTGVLGTLGWVLLWPAWVTVKLIVVPAMAHASRRNEYEADRAAANLGDDYRLGLRRALTELAVWEKPRTGWEDALAATHPPIELRLERLEGAESTTSRPYAAAPATVAPSQEWTVVNVRATDLPPRALTDKKALDRAYDAQRAVLAYQEAYQGGDERRIAKAKERSDRATRAFLDAVRSALQAGGVDPNAYFPENRRHIVNITLPDIDVAIYETIAVAPVQVPAPVQAEAPPLQPSPEPDATAAPTTPPPADITEVSPLMKKLLAAASEVQRQIPARQRTTKMVPPPPSETPAPPTPPPAIPPADDSGAAARWLPQSGPNGPTERKPRSPGKKPRGK